MTTDRPRSSLAVLLAVATALLPAAYVLSLGPAAWLYDRGYLSDDVFYAYAPLKFLRNNWYIELWR
jgi:hypothetical protein